MEISNQPVENPEIITGDNKKLCFTRDFFAAVLLQMKQKIAKHIFGRGKFGILIRFPLSDINFFGNSCFIIKF